MKTIQQKSAMKCGATIIVNRGAYADLLIFSGKAGADSAYNRLNSVRP